MAMNQAGVSVAVGRFGCVLAQGIFTSFSEPQSAHFLKCPNLISWEGEVTQGGLLRG